MEIAAHTGVHELDDDFLPNAFEIAIAPALKRVRRSRAATFLNVTLILTTGRMRFDFVWRTPNDIDTAAIGSPAGNAGGEMFVRIGDAAVVLFLEFVFFSVGRRIAAQPELFDESVTLFVVAQ